MRKCENFRIQEESYVGNQRLGKESRVHKLKEAEDRVNLNEKLSMLNVAKNQNKTKMPLNLATRI